MTDLVKRLSAAETLLRYNQAIDCIRRGFEKVQEAKDILDATFVLGGDRYGGHSIDIHDQYGRVTRWDNPKDVLANVERQAWRLIVERLELRQFLSVTKWNELERQLQKGEMPPLNSENMQSLVTSFTSQFDALLVEAVQEVYGFLRPRMNHLKTNREDRVGRKVILTSWVERWSTRWHVQHYHQQRAMALENVFRALDGAGQASRTHRSELENAIGESESGKGETKYFEFACYGNGNLHLTFKREDLVFRLNQIAGSGQLSAPEAAQ